MWRIGIPASRLPRSPLCRRAVQKLTRAELPPQSTQFAQEGKNFWELYALFNIHDWRLSSIDKMAALQQAPKVLALFFVVAFGSSLDVAAIQAGLADPLDFNHELKTVGRFLSPRSQLKVCRRLPLSLVLRSVSLHFFSSEDH